MQEDIDLIIEVTDEHMRKSIDHLDRELAKIRAGKANPKILDGILVDYYGSMTHLNQVSSISTPDPRTIAIQPWEKAMISPIEKAIMAANLGLNPENNGETIRINIPPLTEERRQDLVKQAKKEAEEARIGIRSARRTSNEELKKLKDNGLSEDLEKDAEAEVQKLTDKYIKMISDMLDNKEKEIMTV